MTESTCHIPVMFDEVLRYLNAARGGRFLDCTTGGAGHTEGILKANPENRVTAFDRDSRALARAARKLSAYGDRVELKHAPFSRIAEELCGEHYDGMLADLGVSTDQIKENRGFSFKDDSPLDMRMDESESLTAAAIVNEFSERELFVVLKQGGVGSEAKAIARAIVRARPIRETSQLAGIVSDALRGRYREKQGHPATVVFQALRMKVNDESGELEALLDSAPRLVVTGGRFVVITFHSIEDKVVTHKMREWQQGEQFSALSPGAKRPRTLGKMVERKAVTPTESELEVNPSARSARLRIFEFA